MTQPRNLGAFADNLNSSGVLQTTGGGTGLTTVGTNGQVIQSNGTSLQWGSVASNFKSDFTRYYSSLSLPASINTSTAALLTMLSVQLTSTTELVFFLGASSLQAAVWDNTAKSFGTAVLIRTVNFNGNSDVAAYAISSTSVLVCSVPYGLTSLSTVILSISGTTITVNTAVATTLANASAFINGQVNNNASARLLAIGSTYVLSYFNTSTSVSLFRAITVSGTTPTIGSELSTVLGILGQSSVSLSYSSTILLNLNYDGANIIYATPISVSGTTLTKGTAATISSVGGSSNVSGASTLSSGRVAFFYKDGPGSNMYGVIVSVSGTTATISKAIAGGPTSYIFGQTIGSKVVYVNQNDNSINVLTDNSGTAVIGTNAYGYGTPSIVGYDGTNVFIQNDGNALFNVSISGNNPVIGSNYPFTQMNVSNFANSVISQYDYYYSNNENATGLKTASNKCGNAFPSSSTFGSTSSNFQIFSASYDGASPMQIQQMPANGGPTNSSVFTKSPLNTYSGFSAYAIPNSTNTGYTKLVVSRMELS